MTARRVALHLVLAGAVAGAPLLAVDTSLPITLDRAEPFRLVVSSSGAAQTIRIAGTNFESEGHPDRDEYMHWQIRRDDGGWSRCARTSTACRGTGWTGTDETLAIGGAYLAREGFVELRVFGGLADAGANAPSEAASGHTEWSNVLRIPVVVPGPPPAVRSLSQSAFPFAGGADDYHFRIDVEGADGTPVAVFDERTVVYPERFLEGHLVEMTVPEALRAKPSHAIALAVRTDRGGLSPAQTLTLVDPKAPTPISRTLAAPGAALAPREPVEVIASVADACPEGFVWREARPADHVCVTPARRAEVARENHDASTHRAPNDPDRCLVGYVWREAFADDHVCVVPESRARAAQENAAGR